MKAYDVEEDKVKKRYCNKLLPLKLNETISEVYQASGRFTEDWNKKNSTEGFF